MALFKRSIILKPLHQFGNQKYHFSLQVQFRSRRLFSVVSSNCSSGVPLNRILNYNNINSKRFSSTTVINWHDTLYRNYSHQQQQSLQKTEPVIKPLFSLPSSSYRNLITSEEIVQRQQNLIQLTCNWLRQISNNSSSLSPLILIASSTPQYQSNTKIPVNDCKQNSDFTYFTGLHSGSSDQLTSDCVLSLYLDETNALRSVIFAPKRSKSDELWHGSDLISHYKKWLTLICDEVKPLSELVDFVNRQIKPERRDVFISRNGLQTRPELVTHLKYFMKYSSGADKDVDIEKWSTSLTQSVKSVNVRDASNLIDQLRVIKSDAECRALHRIGFIGSQALKNTIEWSQHMIHEQDETFNFLESHIAAKFDFESRLYGSKKLSFPSVCASGPRSTIIHYGRNDCPINLDQDDCWVLTDVGCEDIDGYVCDISRTWPVNKHRFNSDHFQLRLQLYEALYGVQQTLIQSIIVGHTTLNDLHKQMWDLLNNLLLEFNVFENPTSARETLSITKKICPHHVSHYIGT